LAPASTLEAIHLSSWKF